MPTNISIKSQKLVSVSEISPLIIVASIKTNLGVILRRLAIALPQVLCIQYLALFDQFSIEIFINFGSKVNTMQPSFTNNLVSAF